MFKFVSSSIGSVMSFSVKDFNPFKVPVIWAMEVASTPFTLMPASRSLYGSVPSAIKLGLNWYLLTLPSITA